MVNPGAIATTSLASGGDEEERWGAIHDGLSRIRGPSAGGSTTRCTPPPPTPITGTGSWRARWRVAAASAARPRRRSASTRGSAASPCPPRPRGDGSHAGGRRRQPADRRARRLRGDLPAHARRDGAAGLYETSGDGCTTSVCPGRAASAAASSPLPPARGASAPSRPGSTPRVTVSRGSSRHGSSRARSGSICSPRRPTGCMRESPEVAPRLLVIVLAAALGLAVVPAAAADLADETALAEKFAPVVRLVEQEEECGPGEPYEPMDVDALFGDSTVALRGPWNASDLVKIGPTADDLAGLFEYHLDFPGDALEPGCSYERGHAGSRRAPTPRSTRTWHRNARLPGSSRCSTGSSTPSTTSTTRTRATGR